MPSAVFQEGVPSVLVTLPTARDPPRAMSTQPGAKSDILTACCEGSGEGVDDFISSALVSLGPDVSGRSGPFQLREFRQQGGARDGGACQRRFRVAS